MTRIGSTNENPMQTYRHQSVIWWNFDFLLTFIKLVYLVQRQLESESRSYDNCNRFHGLYADNCDKYVTKRSNLTVLTECSILSNRLRTCITVAHSVQKLTCLKRHHSVRCHSRRVPKVSASCTLLLFT